LARNFSLLSHLFNLTRSYFAGVSHVCPVGPRESGPQWVLTAHFFIDECTFFHKREMSLHVVKNISLGLKISKVLKCSIHVMPCQIKFDSTTTKE
jgi:hypothetical protein